MQLIVDGPEIPVKILDEQQKGKLVFFCGAGISKPEGLPIFKELVDRLKEDLGLGKYPKHIKEEYCKNNYDRVFTYFDNTFSREEVLKHVFKHLEAPDDLQSGNHSSISSLAKTRIENNLRLVTTNFDHLFEEAVPNINYHEAPALPVPKPYKWDSLVYLHGRINKNDLKGNHLIINTGDFGLAYLFEGWAAKFITELFRHFTVLFVGYSADDPIMRYIIDALAIEREKGIELKKAYALAPYYSEKDKNRIEEIWRSKNINPILYNAKDDHQILIDTLSEWSDLWEGGWEAQKEIITRIGTNRPEALHEKQINQFLYALTDHTGEPAKVLKNLGHTVTPKWIEYIEKSKYWTSNKDHKSNGSDLFNQEFFKGIKADDSRKKIYQEISYWLLSDLKSSELIEWVISKNLKVGPYIKSLLKRELPNQIKEAEENGTEFGSKLINFWLLVINKDREDHLNDSFWINSLLEQGVWSEQLKKSLLKLLKINPTIRF